MIAATLVRYIYIQYIRIYNYIYIYDTWCLRRMCKYNSWRLFGGSVTFTEIGLWAVEQAPWRLRCRKPNTPKSHGHLMGIPVDPHLFQDFHNIHMPTEALERVTEVLPVMLIPCIDSDGSKMGCQWTHRIGHFLY